MALTSAWRHIWDFKVDFTLWITGVNSQGEFSGDVGDLLGKAADDGPLGAPAPLLTSMFVVPPAGFEPAACCLEDSRRRFADQGVSEECLVRHLLLVPCQALSSGFERVTVGDLLEASGRSWTGSTRPVRPLCHGWSRAWCSPTEPVSYPRPASKGRPMRRSVRLRIAREPMFGRVVMTRPGAALQGEWSRRLSPRVLG